MTTAHALSSIITEPEALFGVTASLTGSLWKARACDERLALALSQRLDVPEVIGRALAARGVGLDDAEGFLTPSLRQHLPDPSTLKDMDKASARIADIVLAGGAIGIFGDYDVDGATSTALLTRFFRHLGITALPHIPDRMKEGYGPNAPALLALKDKGARAVITVDCGTVAFEPLAAAKDAGIEVIVVDHHIGEPRLPDVFAVINPNRFDEDRALGHLAAVGVAFLLVVAVNRSLRERGFYKSIPEPDLLQWLDLVALGTVCDVVSLTGLNRAFVAQGLRILGQRRNAGLAALIDVAGVTEAPGTYHAGFLLGPRVNAGGRVGEAPLGATLLSTENAEEARRIAARLHVHNAERQAIEAFVQESASAQIDRLDPLPPFVCAVGEGWHPGVIGIVAGRLKERTNRPSAVIALEGGIGKASARSIPGVDLGAAITAARHAGLLLAGGGHAMAAGFTVEADKIPALLEFLNARLTAEVARHGAARALSLDGILSVGGITPALSARIEQLAPFGVGNPEPRFVLPECRVLNAGVVGENHVRCILGDGGLGRSASPARIKAIAFRALGTPLGDALITPRARALHIAGHIRINRWQGQENAELLIDDAAWAK
ncbi:MAG: single-stranded-DNA-specific exonuclease RecJ [Alphaproteobacteria bacterium]|nr:single-stranded-DNA-specific exonuclease RecJ [Alphaproteobacteria bacterium]